MNLMKMTMKASVFLFICTITASGLVMADCSKSMPEQLLEDCIVYEGAGANFPTSDYAHMALYKEWQMSELAKLESTAAGVEGNIHVPQSVAK
jgi:hypothetical protein